MTSSRRVTPPSERPCRYSAALLRAATALNISVRPSEGVEVVICAALAQLPQQSCRAHRPDRGGEHRFGWRRSFFFFSLRLLAVENSYLWSGESVGRSVQPPFKPSTRNFAFAAEANRGRRVFFLNSILFMITGNKLSLFPHLD